MDFLIKKDNDKKDYVYIGVPAKDLKGKIDLRKCVNDEGYQYEIIRKYMKLAEAWSQVEYDNPELYGFIEGYMFIHARVIGPVEGYNLLDNTVIN